MARVSSGRASCCPARFIPASQLDELVWADLRAVLERPELVAQAVERAHSGAWVPGELRRRQATLRSVRASVARQRQRLLEAYLAEVIDLNTFQRQDQTLGQQEADLLAREREVAAQGERLAGLSAIARSMTAVLEQLRVGLGQAGFEQRRQLVELLIDRVVVTDGQVEIRYVIPTTDHSAKTRFCHLRTDYFHLIALPVAGPVKGWRSATSGTATGPVGLLVVALRDRVPDVAGPQGGPVGPAGVGLVPGQMIGTLAGPTVATRAGHPHGVHQPDQLAGVGGLARGQLGHQVATATVADRVELGGQPAAGAPQRLLAACLD
jgi:site-specific DNA recombinase